MEIALIRVLRSCKGEFTFGTAVRLMAAALLIAAMMAVYHVYYTIGAVREKVNESVTAVAAANVAEFYNAARESDGHARHYEGSSFASLVTTDDVLDTLSRNVGASDYGPAGEIIVRDSYTISGLSTAYVNGSVSGTSGALNFKTTLTVTVPIRFAGINAPISKTIVVRSTYEAKF